MPLPDDVKVVALANDLMQQFDKIFGLHPGFRPAHAKGLMLAGTFRPSPKAHELTNAAHIVREATPVFARFSNSTGLPLLPDSAPDANPRGLAVRFQLGEHVHTDIVAHSTDGFPTRTGDEFLEVLKAIAASGPDVPSPKPIEQYVGSHPAALAFVQAPKPFPVSLATQTYFAVTSFIFTNAEGVKKHGRYRIVPETGNEFLSADDAAKLTENYHFDEIATRAANSPLRFKILIQIAAPEDPTDDATIHWPESREVIELGTLELDKVVDNNFAEQKQIIFDPIPRLEGIEASADPLLELRAAIYLISGRRRRAAEPQTTKH